MTCFGILSISHELPDTPSKKEKRERGRLKSLYIRKKGMKAIVMTEGWLVTSVTESSSITVTA